MNEFSPIPLVPGHVMPSTMTTSMWEEMAFVKTVQRRLSLYTLFALREQYKEKSEQKKLEKPSKKARHLQEKLRNEFGKLFAVFNRSGEGASSCRCSDLFINFYLLILIMLQYFKGRTRTHLLY